MNSKTSITNDIYLTSHKLANGEYVANLPEGTTIYSSGRNGTSNGKIISTSASLKIVDYNKTMKKLVKTDASAAAGDSGGLVYYYYGTSEKKIAGVITAADDQSNMYYCRASKVNEELGVEPY